MPDIKILISCHKDSTCIENDILKPIQVGCANTKFCMPSMLHDDEGENISCLNKMYCELTAQYWAWKNLDVDYYGFFHYRRYLAFKDTKEKENPWGCIELESLTKGTTISEEVIDKYGWNEEDIQKGISGYDVVLPTIKSILKMPGRAKTMEEQFGADGSLHQSDMDLMKEVLSEKYPEFVPYMNTYLEGSMTYFNNMFLMKKDLFKDYCEWMFSIVDECYKRADYSDYSVEAKRTPGHLAERLLNIYILWLKDKMPDVKIMELETVAIEKTEPLKLAPAYDENNIAIVLSANDYYVPYVSTLLLSMKEHFRKGNFYDIIVMNRDITADSQKGLMSCLGDADNICLRFFDVSIYQERFSKLYLRGHFALETYFRLLMPEILGDYDKVLYLDSDMIAMADVADLYNTDVEGFLLAGCKDADTAGLYNGFEEGRKEYMDNILKIEKPYDYFQAGTLLFNLKEWRKKYTTDEILKFAGSNDWKLLDQDVLNYLSQGYVKFVDMSWNMMTDWDGIRINEIISLAPEDLKEQYMEARKHPFIIHYAGPDKPWIQPESDFSEEFWKYAKASIFYDEIINRSKKDSKKAAFEAKVKKAAKRKMPKGLYIFLRRIFYKFTGKKE